MQNEIGPHLMFILLTHLGRLTLSLGLPRATKGPGGGWASTGLFRASFSFLDLRANFFSSLAFSFSLSFSWSWWFSMGAPLLLVWILAGAEESFPLAIGQQGQTKEVTKIGSNCEKYCYSGKASDGKTHLGAVRESIQCMFVTGILLFSITNHLLWLQQAFWFNTEPINIILK